MPYLHSRMKGLCLHESQEIARRRDMADSHLMSQKTPIPTSSPHVWLWVIYFSSVALNILIKGSLKSLPALKTVSMRVVLIGGPEAGPEITHWHIQSSYTRPDPGSFEHTQCSFSPTPPPVPCESPTLRTGSLLSPALRMVVTQPPLQPHCAAPFPPLQIPISCLADL